MRVGFFSLGGGQGKTTCAWLTHKAAQRMGKPLVVIDGDPQGTLSMVLGIDTPLAWLIRGEDVGVYKNLGESPEMNSLSDWLYRTGNSWAMLRNKLDDRDAVIDMPPQISALTQTLLGACDQIYMPVEATPKGYDSLVRSINYFDQAKSLGVQLPKFMGVIPMRVVFYGNHISRPCQEVLDGLDELIRNRHDDSAVFEMMPERQCYRTALGSDEVTHDMKLWPFEQIVMGMSYVVA